MNRPNCFCLACRAIRERASAVTVTPLPEPKVYTLQDMSDALIRERRNAFNEGLFMGKKIGRAEAAGTL